MLVDEFQNSTRIEETGRCRYPDGCRVAAPSPGLWLFGESSSDGIQGDVDDRGGQVLIRRDPLRVEATVEEISVSFVSLVEVSGVRGQQPLHPDAEVRCRCTDQEMEVRVQEAVGEARPATAANRAAYACQQFFAIALVSRDRLAAAPFRDDVMKSSGYILSGSPWQGCMMGRLRSGGETAAAANVWCGHPRCPTPSLTPGRPLRPGSGAPSAGA